MGTAPDAVSGRDAVAEPFLSIIEVLANFLFADGSLHFIDQTIDAVTYRALSTIDGGETLDRQ